MKKLCICLSLLLAGVLLFPARVSALGLMDYVVGTDSQQVLIPQTHRVTGMIRDLGPDGGKLSQPSDLFIDSEDNIYIADTDNNRIVKLDSAGNYVRSFTCGDTLSAPGGVFVSGNGDLYIADTAHERIVHLSPGGEYIEEFGKPDSELLGDDVTFQISRLAITAQGYLYTIKGQSFMMIDANNEFKGYVGDNRLGFSLTRLLIRTFATKEQQEKLIKEEPPSYYSFDVGPDGLIYATTGESSASNQIQKINMVGNNIYPQKAYGEKFYNEDTGAWCNPRFVDICVDAGGIIYALEAYSCKIYTYDQEGNMLAVFGGNGNVKGRFSQPAALDMTSGGDLLVLDQSTGYIHWYTRTEFMDNIVQAVDYYKDGLYSEAEQAWKQVLDIDANYPVANKGIGDALYKQGNIEDAMTYYKLCESKSGYGAAFSDYQYQVFRKYFGWLVLAAAVVIAGIILLVLRLKKRADRLVDSYYGGGNRNE